MARAGLLALATLVCACAVGVMSLDWDLRGLNSYTIPVLIWSDNLLFTPAQSQIVDTWNTKDVDGTLSTLLFSSEMNKQSQQNTQPTQTEVVVLFLEPELSTDQVSRASYGGYFTHLQSALGEASSSLSVPYTTVTDVSLFDEAIARAVGNLHGGSVVLARMPNSKLLTHISNSEDVKTVSVDSLVAELQSSGVYTNKVVDLVIVCFDKDPTFASHDEIIQNVNDAVRTATGGNYVAVFSGNMPTASRVFWAFDQHATEESHFQQVMLGFLENGSNGSNTSNSTSSGKINFFPGPLIEVYLITAILIAMLFTGGCAIFSLQTPDRWDAPKVKREVF